MFRTNKRTLLYLPINDVSVFHYVAPQSDEPRLILQYVTPAERDRIIAKHTVKKFYPRPMDTNAMLQVAKACWDLPIVKQRALEVAESLALDAQVIGNVWTAITRDLTFLPQPEFIERDERDNTAILIEVCEKAIVGWEEVRDDDTGEMIPFSFQQLRTFLAEGGDFTLWCMQHIPQVMQKFDDLLKEQRIQAEKNSSGLSAIPSTPAA